MKKLSECHILIVDDSKPIFLMVKEMLEECGVSAEWAENGSVAVEKSIQKNYDIILLDWNMPELNGPEFLEKNLTEKFTQSPIVMMTTENGPDYIKKALELGASEYIMKPFSKDILVSKIEFALKGS